MSRHLARGAWGVFPVRPETLPRWHRDLVRRRWAASGRCRQPGRPPLPADLRRLIARLAAENPRRGDQRIRGELLKLGHDIPASAVRTALRRSGVPPAPRRAGPSWRAFLRARAGAVLGCDFFTVETVRLHIPRVLFLIGLRTRRVFVAGCTAHPTAARVAQQARNVCRRFDGAGLRPAVLIRDRDAKVPRAFDDVCRAQGARAVRAPHRAPRARAHAERWVGTVRRGCLDWLLIVGERHLDRVLREYAEHDNAARPHRALQLRSPVPRGQPVSTVGGIARRDRLGGLVHEYERLAA